MDKTQVNTREEAQQKAIDWQHWANEQNQAGEEPTLYTSDLIEWREYFAELAKKFELIEEFEENGII